MSTRRLPPVAAFSLLPLLVGVVVGVGPASATSDDAATRIVETARAGEPLRVVTTTLGHEGRPIIRTAVADTRARARALVARALRDSDVESVSMALPATTAASNDMYRSRQWGLSRLQAEAVWKRTDGAARGSGSTRTRRAVVAVVDTGVDASHPDLRGNVLAGYDVVDPGTSAADPNGHGTHVAGTVAALAGNRRGVAGLAPRAAILPVRVLDSRGAGTSDDIARGIVLAADRQVHVINLSLSIRGNDPAVQRAVAYARAKGKLVVAAAGNSGCGLLRRTSYPAAYPGVVGVGSVDSSLQGSRFSSCGSWVDVAAPGGGIWSTTPATNQVGCASYCSLSGTSMATPHVAAAGALAMSRRGWSAASVAARLESTARDLGARGKDITYGAGLVDVRALVG